jgi:hypothetical protein
MATANHSSVESAAQSAPADVMAAQALTGNEVLNCCHEKLGDIEAIMLDVLSGRIAYAVMVVPGVYGLQDKLYAIPWQALILDHDHHRFILDADMDRLSSAPEFDEQHRLSDAEREWPLVLPSPDARLHRP